MDRRDLHLEYPCRWDYHVIGEDEHKLRIAVAGIVGNVAYVLSLANRSRKGRYLSLHLTLEVTDEEHRLRVFEELRQHDDVKYVL
jgi:hypothetical protein